MAFWDTIVEDRFCFWRLVVKMDKMFFFYVGTSKRCIFSVFFHYIVIHYINISFFLAFSSWDWCFVCPLPPDMPRHWRAWDPSTLVSQRASNYSLIPFRKRQRHAEIRTIHLPWVITCVVFMITPVRKSRFVRMGGKLRMRVLARAWSCIFIIRE